MILFLFNLASVVLKSSRNQKYIFLPILCKGYVDISTCETSAANYADISVSSNERSTFNGLALCLNQKTRLSTGMIRCR